MDSSDHKVSHDLVLKTRVPNVQLIIGDDEAAAVEKAKQEADSKESEAKADAEAAAAAEAEEEGGSPEGKAGGGDGGEGGFEPIESIVWMYETENGWLPHPKEISAQIEKVRTPPLPPPPPPYPPPLLPPP